MNISLLTHNWGHPWIELYREAVQARGHSYGVNEKNADAFLHMWSDGSTQPVDGAKNYFFLRRFELFSKGIHNVNWKNVDRLFCVNSWIADQVRPKFGRIPVSVVYNSVDPRRWTFKPRTMGYNIGMACHVHPKKNLPLAVQILAHLPSEYELHIAGEVQDKCTESYIDCIGKAIRRRIVMYGHVPSEDMNLWWENMQYCLSTSISEGSPNNVMEAMAKGIKPVVHLWPGAEDQFNGFTFKTVDDAVQSIQAESYEPEKYRQNALEKFGLRNIETVLDYVEA